MKFRVRTLLVGVGIAAVLLGVFVRLIMPAREAARITSCKNNLRQIALAMMNYESAYGGLPMSVENGPDGRPWHSWRSRIYPVFMEQSSQVYDPGKPWDSPTNLRLLKGTPVPMFGKGGNTLGAVSLDPTPDTLCCPSDTEDCELYSQVSYLVVTGSQTAFPANKSVALSEMTDGSENTILVVESVNSAIKWTQPGDLEIDSMSFKLNERSKPSISSRHPGGANVIFADGAVYFMTNEITENELKALLTIAGGEDVTREDLVRRGVLK